ncbi:DUF4255 domain-containing protein [Ornithinimicrobium sp. F0845]|uniref:DUF4255 domain-containing protein n=1 Tax=Ornithinimicrobium sp. F0845 TaxID=2926412 RepID=UPI001FF62F8C|nr:DUF4255 domain-containing protein [Ornithinimicrobium sp. F0845]
MIHEVDSAVKALIEREATGAKDVEVVFDAPTKEWAGRRSAPTIDVYLYDIREDMRRRTRGMINEYSPDQVVIGRRLPPRHFKLSYLITAWTARPEDEHRLLAHLLECFLKFDQVPPDLLTGSLAEAETSVAMTIALPPPEDRSFADVWTALGGELKPSLDLVVTAPLETRQGFETGPPVQEAPLVSMGGVDGWPSREEPRNAETRQEARRPAIKRTARARKKP